MKKRRFKHLSWTDRLKIETMLKDKRHKQEIADEIGVHLKTIYNEIKRGKRPDMRAFYRVANRMLDDGCDLLVLGCTELSLLERDYHLGGRFVDSIDALARAAVLACGRTLCEDGGI